MFPQPAGPPKPLKTKYEPGSLPGLDKLAKDLSSGRIVPAGGLERNFAPLNYFEAPQNVTKWYHKVFDNPATPAPSWVDTKTLKLAYDFLKYKNKDLPEDQWLPVTPEDPVAAMYGTMAAPPVDQLNSLEKQWYSSMQSIRTGQSGKEIQAQWMNKTFWLDPQRVVRYYNAVRTLPTNWQGPEWVSPTFLKQAYDVYKTYNKGLPTDQWKPLPKGNPGNQLLITGPVPPQETWAAWDQPKDNTLPVFGASDIIENSEYRTWYLAKQLQRQGLSPEEIEARLAPRLAQEKAFAEGQPRMPTNESMTAEGNALTVDMNPAEKPLPDFNKLHPWQQLVYSAIYPGRPGEMTGRSAGSRAAAAISQGVLPGLGVGAMVSSIASPVIGIPAGLLVFAGTAGQAYFSDKPIPVLSDIFGALAIGGQIPEVAMGLYAIQLEDQKKLRQKYEKEGYVFGTSASLGYNPKTKKTVNLGTELDAETMMGKSAGEKLLSLKGEDALFSFNEQNAKWKISPGNILPKALNADIAAAGMFYETQSPVVVDLLFYPDRIDQYVKERGLKGPLGPVSNGIPALISYLRSYPARKANQVYILGANAPTELEPDPWTGEIKMGTAAMVAARDKIIAGVPFDAVYKDVSERYGLGGWMNDFMGQNVFNLLNLAPMAEAKLTENVAMRVGAKDLAMYARAARGDFIADALPMPLNSLYSHIFHVESSKGFFQIVGEYHTIGRTGFQSLSHINMPSDMQEAYKMAVLEGADPHSFKFDGPEMTWKKLPTTEIPEPAEMKFTSQHGSIENVPGKKWSELTPLERRLLGINEEGRFAELEPTPDTNWFVKLFKLEPDAQAAKFVENYHDAIQAIVSEYKGESIDELVKILKATAEADPKAIQRADRAFMDTPVIYTVADALKKGVEDPRLVDIVNQWHEVQNVSSYLNNLSLALEIEPGKIVEMINTEKGVTELAARVESLKSPAAEINQFANPENIKKVLGVFAGEDALAWHPAQYVKKVMRVLTENVDTYLVEKYHIAPDPLGIRVSHLLKSTMSLFVLSNNAMYAMNNAINDVVSRAGAGVSGWVDPRIQREWLEEMGVTPYRYRVGVGFGGEREIDVITGREDFPPVSALYQAKRGGKVGIKIDTTKGAPVVSTELDFLAKAQDTVRAINNKFGMMTKLSNWIEKQESEQATFIGGLRFWDRNRKYGIGITQFPPELEAFLKDYPATRALMIDALESGLNMDQVLTKMYTDPAAMQINIPDMVDEIATRRFPDEPGILKETLKETIGDQLNQLLPRAKSVQEINRIFDFIEANTDMLVDDWHGRILRARADEVATLSDSEQMLYIVDAHNELSRYIQNEWAIEHFNEIKDLYEFTKDLTGRERTDAWRLQNTKDAARFNVVKERHLATLDGIFRKLNVNDPDEALIVTSTRAIYDLWSKFYELSQEKRARFFRTDYSTKEARKTAYYTMELEIQEDYKDTYFGNAEKGIQGEQGLNQQIDNVMANIYAQRTGSPREDFLAWRQDVTNVRDYMAQAQIAARSKAMDAETPAARYDLLDQFFDKEYRKLVDKLEETKRNGARKLFDKNKDKVPEPVKVETAEAAEVVSVVEADNIKKTTQKETAAAVDAAEIKSKAIQNRKMFKEAVLQKAPHIPPREMTAAMAIFDMWIENNWLPLNPGKTIDDFYATVFDRVVAGVEKGPEHFDLATYQDIMAENAYEGAKIREERTRIAAGDALVSKALDEEIVATILNGDFKLEPEYKAGDGETYVLSVSNFKVKLSHAEAMKFMDFQEAKLDIPDATKAFTTYRKFLEQKHPDHFNAENIGEEVFNQITDAISGKKQIYQQTYQVYHLDGSTMRKLNTMPKTLDIRKTGFVTQEGNLIDISVEGSNARAEHFDWIRKNFPQYWIPGDMGGTINAFMKATGAIRLSSSPFGDSAQFAIQSAGPLSQHQIKGIADGIMSTSYPGLIHVTAEINGDNKNISIYKATALEDLRDGLFRKSMAGDSLMYQSYKQNAMEIAKSYGFTTAKETGAPDIPEEMHLLRAIKKYYPEKYGDMDVKQAMQEGVLYKMPPEDMVYALEERRIQHGDPPVFPTYRDDTKGSIAFGADGKATLKLFEAADISTVIHEFGHVIQRMMSDQHRYDAEAWLSSEVQRLNKMMAEGKLTQEQMDSFFVDMRGNRLKQIELMENGQWSYAANEIFSRAFERHLSEDNSIPVPKKIQAVFEAITQALRKVYNRITGQDYTGTPLDLNINLKVKTADGRMVSIKDVFDRMLHGENLAKGLEESKATLQSRPTGKTTFAFDPTDPNIKYQFQYKVVDLDELIPSNTDAFQPNENYPSVLQPRERGSKTSQKQVIDIAAGLVPEKVLIDVTNLADGTPIIGDDMAVEGGNGRVMGFRMARESYPENWAKYRQYLVEHAAEFGIKPEDVEGIANPVLVRERLGLPEGIKDRGEFAFRTSKGSAAGFTPEEIAVQDATKWTPGLVSAIKVGETDSIDTALRLVSNKEIVNKFIQGLDDKTDMFTKDGQLSAKGIQRIKASLFAYTFESDAGRKLLTLFTENVDNNIKTLENSIYANLPELAKMEGKIKAGTINADYSIAEDLARLIEEYGRRKREGIGIGQDDLFGATSGADKKLIDFFYNNARSRKNIDAFIQEYLDLVNKQPAPDQMSLVPMETISKETLLSMAVDHADLNTSTYFPTDYDGTIVKLDKPRMNTTLKKMIDRQVVDADGNVVAEMPVKSKLQRIKTTSGESATVFGYDPEDPNRIVYYVNGEIRKTDPLTQEYKQIGFKPNKQYETLMKSSKLLTKTDNILDSHIMDRDGNIYKFNDKNMTHIEFSNILLGDQGVSDSSFRQLFSETGWVRIRYTYGDFLIQSFQPLTYEQTASLTNKIPPGTHVYHGGAEFIAPKDKLSLTDKLLSKYGGEYRQVANPVGKVPPGSTPEMLDQSKLNSEANASILRPLIGDLRQKAIENFNNRPLKGIPVDAMPEPVKKVLDGYLNVAKSDMIISKNQAARMGTFYRDNALLNYSERYGIDNYTEMLFPYQFWFTRTAMNWLKRVMDRPMWLAMYANYEELRKKAQANGLPTRFNNMNRMYAPWLPAGFGGAVFADPIQQLFPLSQVTNIFKDINQAYGKQDNATKQIIEQQVRDNKISRADADKALEETSGNKIWDAAAEQAAAENDYTQPYNLMSLAMSPAMWIDIPAKILGGNAKNITNLPMTRQGQAIGAALQDTPLQGVGNLAKNVMAGPETVIRKYLDLPEYSGWYDYYVSRSISNMAAEGLITANQASYAIAFKQGPAYDMGVKRTQQELSLKVPGMSLVYALKKGISLAEMPIALIESLFPGGILQEGELKYRGLYTEYQAAWSKFEQGDKSAINDFFKKYPEYETRLAIFQDPNTQMRNFITDKVWENYSKMSAANKKAAAQQLGQQFQEEFLGGRGKYDGIPTETLMYWAQFLGAKIPVVQSTAPKTAQPVAQPVQEYQPLAENVQITPKTADLWDPATTAAITEYERIKDRDYPNIDAIQSGYFAYPEGSPERKKYLNRFKQLKQFWGWKDDYRGKHPELEPYFAKKSMDFEATGQSPDYSNEVVKQMTPELVNQLSAYYYRNIPLAPGAYAELRYLWEQAGKPGGTLLKFIDNYVKPGFVQ
jgi:hypothetical protein